MHTERADSTGGDIHHRILVVDHDPEFAVQLAGILQPHGYSVIPARTPAEALEKLTESGIEVALVNARLGRDSGLALIERIRRSLPRVLCIVVTTRADLEAAIQGLHQGAYDYVCKPVNAESVLAGARRTFDKLRLEREKAEMADALRASEERLRLALEGINDGVWEWQISSGRGYRSARWGTMLGFEPGELDDQASTWEKLIHPKDRERVWAAINDHFARRTQSYEAEYRLKAKSGRWVWVLDRGKVVQRDEDGKPIRAVGTHTDVTDRKQAEEDRAALQEQLHQARKMESIGQLAGGVAHDFSNLLTVISGSVERLRSRTSGVREQAESLGMISQAVEEATGITQSLLTFGREMEMQPERVNLCAMVQRFGRMLRHLLPATIELALTTKVGPPVWVEADETQLQQVMLNLAVNARDAMPDGGRLEFKVLGPRESGPRDPADPGPQDCGLARLTVLDTGVGMTPEVRTRAFDPFYTTKPRGRGTGLGLAIVHGIVQKHGGHIDIQSTPNEGTTVTVLLPAVESGTTVAPPDSPVAPATGQGELILLAEDHRYVREIMAATLRDLGYDVLQTSDGDAMVERYRQNRGRIALVIVDVQLPQRSGLDALRTVRRDGAKTPAIVITGSAEHLIEHQLQEDDLLLCKPFQMSELGRLVASVLRRRPPVEAAVR